MDATAYTVGSDVVFARGAFDPRSAKGLETLAHELAHVAQGDGVTARGRSAVPGPLSVSDPADTSDRQASHAARAVVSGGSYQVARSRPRAATHRDPSGRPCADDAPVLHVRRQQAPAQPGPAPGRVRRGIRYSSPTPNWTPSTGSGCLLSLCLVTCGNGTAVSHTNSIFFSRIEEPHLERRLAEKSGTGLPTHRIPCSPSVTIT
ncbi:hypothetical protein GCM10010377_79110 [Streptomyces viridiviolaceus]|nr:hypothetical protein GCM10010377_79110 [Streptomyces viridiviolaceus]